MITFSDPTDIGITDDYRTIRIGKLKLYWPFPIVRGSGSSAIVFGLPVWGGGRQWVKSLHHFFLRFRDARYWFLYRFSKDHQYHIVRTGLEPGYYDVDTIMLNACMTLLCRYVEDEQGGVDKLAIWAEELQGPVVGHEPYEGATKQQGEKDSEAVAIYRWWKLERPVNQRCRGELLHILYGGKSRISFQPTDHPKLSEMVVAPFEGNEVALHEQFRKLERKIDEDEEQMLIRLMAIRRGLWT